MSFTGNQDLRSFFDTARFGKEEELCWRLFLCIVCAVALFCADCSPREDSRTTRRGTARCRIGRLSGRLILLSSISAAASPSFAGATSMVDSGGLLYWV